MVADPSDVTARASSLAHRAGMGAPLEWLRDDTLALGRDATELFRAHLDAGAPGIDSPVGEAQVERLATACELLGTCSADEPDWMHRDACERVLLYALRLHETLTSRDELEHRTHKLVDTRRRARAVWSSLDALVLDASLSRLRHAVTAMSALLGGPHLQSVGPLPRHRLRHTRDAVAASAREPRMPAAVLSLVSQTSNALRVLRTDELLVERRSEERRVGKECRRLCRSRWSPYH
jgi:hypothetical protein